MDVVYFFSVNKNSLPSIIAHGTLPVCDLVIMWNTGNPFFRWKKKFSVGGLRRPVGRGRGGFSLDKRENPTPCEMSIAVLHTSTGFRHSVTPMAISCNSFFLGGLNKKEPKKQERIYPHAIKGADSQSVFVPNLFCIQYNMPWRSLRRVFRYCTLI